MKGKITVIEDVLAIVKIAGEFSVFEENFEDFSKDIIAYTKNGIYRFIIDLEEVTYVDSSGVGVLIRLATTAMKKDTKICVICSQPNVKKVFIVANVDKIIQFVESLEDGMTFYETSSNLKLSKK